MKIPNILEAVIMTVLLLGFGFMVSIISLGIVNILNDQKKPQTVYLVYSCEDLDNIRDDLDGIYIQMSDINCGGYEGK